MSPESAGDSEQLTVIFNQRKRIAVDDFARALDQIVRKSEIDPAQFVKPSDLIRR